MPSNEPPGDRTLPRRVQPENLYAHRGETAVAAGKSPHLCYGATAAARPCRATVILLEHPR